jgi:hypothetical protein
VVEVLVEFDTTVIGPDGVRWAPRVCGTLASDGLWDGWIEFTPTNSTTDSIRTPRETKQPKRADLLYWAQGLTQVYLDDALVRALRPPRREYRRPSARARYESPAPRPVLNPFDVYLQGERVLRNELSALSIPLLRDIVIGFRLGSATTASSGDRGTLIAAILTGVRRPIEAETPEWRDSPSA